MAKKKKGLKSTNRGFAVTSIPKKAPPEPTPQDDSDAKVECASAEVSHTTQTHELVEDETLSRQNAEERSLQELVDRLQERTEKEIVRTIKVRECKYERLSQLIQCIRPSKRKDDILIVFRCWIWMRVLLAGSWKWHALLGVIRVCMIFPSSFRGTTTMSSWLTCLISCQAP